MKKTKNIIFSIVVICSLSACAQKVSRVKDNTRELQTLVFKRNITQESNIHIDKATFNQSIDEFGWIVRVQDNLFGFPDFDKGVIEKINNEIESKTKHTSQSYNDIFHKMATEKVAKFLTKEDRNYLVKQIKAAKQEKWDRTKNSYPLLIFYLQ